MLLDLRGTLNQWLTFPQNISSAPLKKKTTIHLSFEFYQTSVIKMFQITFWPSNGKVVFMFDNDFEIYKITSIESWTYRWHPKVPSQWLQLIKCTWFAFVGNLIHVPQKQHQLARHKHLCFLSINHWALYKICNRQPLLTSIHSKYVSFCVKFFN